MAIKMPSGSDIIQNILGHLDTREIWFQNVNSSEMRFKFYREADKKVFLEIEYDHSTGRFFEVVEGKVVKPHFTTSLSDAVAQIQKRYSEMPPVMN